MARSRARLVVLSSKLRGAEIAKQLGLAGDRQWDAGDPVRPGSMSNQHFAGWALDSRVDRSAGPASHVDEVLTRAVAIAVRLQALAAAGEIDSSRVWIHLDSPETGFTLERDVLRAIADFGSLEVDIYD